MHQIFSCSGWVRGYCHYSYSLFGFSAWINFVSRKHLPFNKLHQDAKSQCRNEKYLWWNTRNEEKTPTHTKLFRIRKLSIDLNVTILTFSVFHFFDFDDILKWDKISQLPATMSCASFCFSNQLRSFLSHLWLMSLLTCWHRRRKFIFRITHNDLHWNLSGMVDILCLCRVHIFFRIVFLGCV